MQMCSLLCLLTTAFLLTVYSLLTLQRIVLLRERMNDGADLLALHVQDKISGMQNASIYLGSLNDVDGMLAQKNPSVMTFSDYADVLQSVAGNDLSIEVLLHKSEKILISDYGLSSYDAFFDQSFLQGLLAEKKHFERWEVRSFQKNIYTSAQQVLSYIRSLPLFSVQNKGYLVVSKPLSALAKTAAGCAEADLGDYAVWLGEDLLLASSADPAQAAGSQMCRSHVEIPVRAAYWMSWGSMLAQALPGLWGSLSIWLAAMILCVLMARLLYRQRMEKLDLLVQEMGGEWTLEEDYEDQLYRIFESMTTELTHARQTTRENQPFLQERLIGELLRTRVPIAQRRENLDSCGISLREPYFAVVQASPAENAFDGQSYLLVQRNVQTQLAELGEVYSTYGDGSSILFLINTSEYAALSQKLETLCETVHDALKSFLSVDVVFSIGLSTEENPHPHDAYVTARDRLSTLRLLDDQPQEAVVLARSSQTVCLHTEHVQQVCNAVISQDVAALENAYDEVHALCFIHETDLKETLKRASVFVMRVCADLAETDDLIPADMPGTVLRQLQQQKTVNEVHEVLRAWCRSLIGGSAEDDNRYVKAALAFIHEHYMHSLSVPEIAEKVKVNPIYLNRLFKAVTGAAISAYLSQYRCEHARRMLLETQASVSEISDACGFSEVRSFIRFFKKYYNETPAEYRRQAKG